MPSPLSPIKWEDKKILAGILLPQLFTWCPLNLYATIVNSEVQDMWHNNSTGVGVSNPSAWNSGLYIITCLSALALSIGTAVLINKIGPKKSLMLGVLASGLGSILLGLLKIAADWNLYAFITICYFGRLLAGFGWISVYAVNLSYIVYIFPERISLFVGIAEILTGLAEVIGIPLGELMMHDSGFYLPFTVFGLLIISTLPLISFLLPKYQDIDTKRKLEPQRSNDSADAYNPPGKLSLKDLFKISPTFFMVMVMFILGVAWSFILTTVEGQMAHTSMAEKGYICWILSTSSITYSLVTPGWGYFASSVRNSRKWIIVVVGLMFGGFMFITAGILVHLEIMKGRNGAALYIIFLILLTISLSAAFVPAFESCMIFTTHNNYESTMRTFGIVSIWVVMGYSLGSCMGAAGGFIAETRTFGYGIPIGIYGIIIILWAAVVFYVFGGRLRFKRLQRIPSENLSPVDIERRIKEDQLRRFFFPRLSICNAVDG